MQKALADETAARQRSALEVASLRPKLEQETATRVSKEKKLLSALAQLSATKDLLRHTRDELEKEFYAARCIKCSHCAATVASSANLETVAKRNPRWLPNAQDNGKGSKKKALS